MAETLEELERRLGLIDKEEDKKPTRLQAIGQAALQGATLGFGDELGLQDRKKMLAAKEEYPWMSTGVETLTHHYHQKY